jgi:DNA polymerase III delta prime subunit
LNPEKPAYFKKLTAEKLGLEEELVKDVVELYWKDVRKAITELQHYAINVEGLGTFLTKPWKLKEMREKFEYMLSKNDGSTFRKMAIKTELEDKVSKIKNLEEGLFKEKTKKQSIKELRHAKANSTNLEKQSSYNRGTVEQDPQKGSGRADISEENEDM